MRFFLILFCVHCLCGVVSAAQVCDTATIQASTPDAQLRDNGDGTVTDLKTDLMWKKCLEGLSGSDCATGTLASYNWQEALQSAGTANSAQFAGYSDWRVPNIKELASIVEVQCNAPAVNSNRFPNLPTYPNVWSSSPSFNIANSWYLLFKTGEVGTQSRSGSAYVRLVRTVTP